MHSKILRFVNVIQNLHNRITFYIEEYETDQNQRRHVGQLVFSHTWRVRQVVSNKHFFCSLQNQNKSRVKNDTVMFLVFCCWCLFVRNQYKVIHSSVSMIVILTHGQKNPVSSVSICHVITGFSLLKPAESVLQACSQKTHKRCFRECFAVSDDTINLDVETRFTVTVLT